jgi:deoxyribodipyrimidine photo-lyase
MNANVSSMRRYTTSLFIFRRDLRIHDNNALNKALSTSDRVLPCFIFDPRQIHPHPYQSKPALRFMMQSLADLKQSLQALGAELALYEAFPVEIIKKIFERHRIQAVFVNRDYTPFSRIRDSELAQVCNDLNIDFHVVPDYLLIEPEQAVKGNSEPYKVFTAFYNNARQLPVASPQALEKPNFMKADGESSLEQLAVQQTECLVNTPPGGRNQALTILGQLDQQKDYLATRDYPFQDATSKLSAHLKFGTCSIREAYYVITQHLGLDHPLLRQLYWRDFFTHIAFHFPHVFGKAFISRYNNLMWDNDKEYFEKWRDGKTGFPIVDAGMRELNSTGFMHNRVRMIVASFLTKDLHISWRWGERYFAQHLVDYDPSINNGNWQWAASTGCDAQPYFRIFNPWLQQQKFDPDCQYIYHWIPELKGISPSLIHNWHKMHSGNTYPAPMVDHALESRAAKERYKDLA